MNARISITVQGETFEQDYTIVETRAPKAYDYHGVIQLEASSEGRFVAIPQGDLAVQEARYASGLYGSRTVEDTPADYVLDVLLQKLLVKQ